MQVSKGTWPAGIEYCSHGMTTPETLFDYVADEAQLLVLGDVETAVDAFLADVAHRYEQRGVDPLRPLLSQSNCG
ncbi:hypothetical protein O9929_19315 [Vibrio lentus]|nr:hypothetical protein [Vibrio lentus]